MQDFTPRISALRTRLAEAEGYLRVAELRARRREKQQEAPPVTDAPPVTEAPPPPKTVEEKLADRYGRRR